MGSLQGNISGTQSLNGGAAINVAVTPNITIGTVTTLDPNSSVIVELDESSTRMNPVFNFGIPAGKTGEKGDAGSIKFIIVNELPTEDIDEQAMYLKRIIVEEEEEQNKYEEYIFTNGAWELVGTAKVEVDLTDYVKNTDYASTTKAGVVKIQTSGNANRGVFITTEGFVSIKNAEEGDIDGRTHAYRPITPSNLDYAVGSVKASETQSGTIKAWTSTNKDGEIGLNISTEV